MAVDPIRSAGDPQTRVVGMQTAALFEQHARMVYGLCRTLLRNPDDADDATQATFVSAYKSLLGGSDVREPAAWLATIARNECTARAHARMREPLPLVEADLRHMQCPEAELDRKALAGELQLAISRLPEKQREAVVLRDLYGLRYTEVSAALGMSVASVESLLFRARRSLRLSLKPLAGGALAVPLALREGIALALPGFTTSGAAGGGAASGAVGLGLLAKFVGGPTVVKIVAGAAAVTAAGSMAVVGVEHPETQHPSSVRALAQPQSTGASTPTGSGTLAGPVVPVSDRHDAGAARNGSDTEHAERDDGDDRGATAGSTDAGNGHEGSEDGGSTGARSSGDTDTDTETPLRSSPSDVETGSRSLSGGTGSGDSTSSEGGDDPLGTHATGSGRDSTSEGKDSDSDSSNSSGESDPDGSSGSSGDSPAVTTPPPA